MQALHHDLKGKLCQAQFRALFMRFVPLEQRAHFASVLRQNLAAKAAADADWPLPGFAKLHLKRQLIEGELFNYLQSAQLRRLRNEARTWRCLPPMSTNRPARRCCRAWKTWG
nr:hypothetical protein [Pseudomonas sp. BIGb0427]